MRLSNCLVLVVATSSLCLSAGMLELPLLFSHASSYTTGLPQKNGFHGCLSLPEGFDPVLPNPARTTASHPVIIQPSVWLRQPVTISLPDETPTLMSFPLPTPAGTYEKPVPDDDDSDDRIHNETTTNDDWLPEVTDSSSRSASVSLLPSASPRVSESGWPDDDLSSGRPAPVSPSTTYPGAASTPEPSRSWQPRQVPQTSPDQTPEPAAATEQENDNDGSSESSEADRYEYPPAPCFEVKPEPFIEELTRDPQGFRDKLASRKGQEGIMFPVPEFAPVIANIELGLQAFISVPDANANANAEEVAVYSDFLEQINNIKEQNYPYRQVMVASWLFAVLSDYHYGRHPDRYNRPDCGLNGLPEELHCAPLLTVYQRFRAELVEPHTRSIPNVLWDSFQTRLMCFYPPAPPAQSILEKELMKLLLYMERTGIIFYPTFSALTCEFMNRSIIWGMFPAGLLNVPWLVTDGDITTTYGFFYHDVHNHANMMINSLNIPLPRFLVNPDSPDYQQQQELVAHTRSIVQYWDAFRTILSTNEYEALQLFFFNGLHERPVSLDAFHTNELSYYLFFSIVLMRKDFPAPVTGLIDMTEFLKYERPHLTDLDILMAMLVFMPFSCARGSAEESGQPLPVPDADDLIIRARKQLQPLQELWNLPDDLLDECIQSLIQNSFYIQWFEKLEKGHYEGESGARLYGLYFSATGYPSLTRNKPPASRPCLLWLLFSRPDLFEHFSAFLAHWLEQNNIHLDPQEGSNHEVLKAWRESFPHLNEEL